MKIRLFLFLNRTCYLLIYERERERERERESNNNT